METINSRIEHIIGDLYAGNQATFAKSVGVSPQVVNNIIGKRQSAPSFDVLQKIYTAADVSAEWLLTGEGDMLKKPSAMREEYERTQLRESVAIPLYTPMRGERTVEEQMVPLLSFEATAGVIESLDDSAEYVQGQILVPGMPLCDGAVHVSGFSMQPLLESGDIVAFKKLQSIDNIHYGDMYIVTLNEAGDIYTSVKWVSEDPDDPDRVLLVSENNHYPPRSARKKDIVWIARVKVCIRFLSMS